MGFHSYQEIWGTPKGGLEIELRGRRGTNRMNRGRGIFSIIQGLIFCLLLLSAPGTVEAAVQNIYSAQNAVGSADGSSCAKAKAVSFFNTDTNWGTGGSQIAGGTTVHLCGTISTSLVFQGSGAANNPITLLFEPNTKMSAPSNRRLGHRRLSVHPRYAVSSLVSREFKDTVMGIFLLKIPFALTLFSHLS